MVLAVVGSACGGDDDENTPAATSTPEPPAELVPELGDLGYQKLPSSQDVIEVPGAKQSRVDFQIAGVEPRKVTFHMYTHSQLAMAQDTFAKVRESWKNPPPGLLGARNVTNEDTTGPDLGDEHHAFRTDRPDNTGDRIWTDVYRFGTTVAVVQVLDRDTADGQLELRTQLASRLEALATP